MVDSLWDFRSEYFKNANDRKLIAIRVSWFFFISHIEDLKQYYETKSDKMAWPPKVAKPVRWVSFDMYASPAMRIHNQSYDTIDTITDLKTTKCIWRG